MRNRTVIAKKIKKTGIHTTVILFWSINSRKFQLLTVNYGMPGTPSRLTFHIQKTLIER